MKGSVLGKSVLAALFLTAACSDDSDATGNSSAAGAAAPAVGGTTSGTGGAAPAAGGAAPAAGAAAPAAGGTDTAAGAAAPAAGGTDTAAGAAAPAVGGADTAAGGAAPTAGGAAATGGSAPAAGGDPGAGGGDPGTGGTPRPITEFPKHWHESKGFGTGTQGGLAGEVYKVTNVNSSGEGSLSDALSEGNRLIVFEIGGVFETDMNPKDNTTVAGQTAPYPGVTCIGGLSMRGSDVVVSHVAVQYDGGGDAGSVGGSNNVLDHSSVYWGMDETITFEGGSNFTMYKSICAEGRQFTGHSDGEHSKGIFMKSTGDVSILGSMVVNNALRNPRVDDGTCFLGNHLVYNHGPGWDHQGATVDNDQGLGLEDCPHCFTKVVTSHYGTVALVGSVSLAGPESSPRAKYFLDGHNSTMTGYVMDNIIKDRDGNDLFEANTEGEFTGGASGEDGAVTLTDTPPLWPDGYEPLPAHEALYEVLRTVGPHPGVRNYHAKRLVEDVANGTGQIIDDPSEVGGYADYAPSEPRPLTVPEGVEERRAWLDAMEDEIAVDRDLDLSRLYNMVGSAASDRYAP